MIKLRRLINYLARRGEYTYLRPIIERQAKCCSAI
jgi:hypothetical protein